MKRFGLVILAWDYVFWYSKLKRERKKRIFHFWSLFWDSINRSRKVIHANLNKLCTLQVVFCVDYTLFSLITTLQVTKFNCTVEFYSLHCPEFIVCETKSTECVCLSFRTGNQILQKYFFFRERKKCWSLSWFHFFQTHQNHFNRSQRNLPVKCYLYS